MSNKTLSVQRIPQYETAWCWAAAAEMVLKYYHRRGVRQCRLANDRFNRNDCCPRSTMPDACNDGVSDLDIGSVYTEWQIDETMHVGPVGFTDLKDEIDGERPVEVGYKLYGDGDYGHAVIVIGYDEDEYGEFVTVNDPDPFRRSGDLPMQDFESADGRGYWWRTWTGIEPTMKD